MRRERRWIRRLSCRRPHATVQAAELWMRVFFHDLGAADAVTVVGGRGRTRVGANGVPTLRGS